ncbi:tape measure protein [uncultured Roseibium sp.]|uniref:tape measure protein n=1 Tax=uncultured Roseibium sp. TaxID=1936171 RepID=UPI002638C4B5|nr:tape measure protein [uncultured Roseibium sp.]
MSNTERRIRVTIDPTGARRGGREVENALNGIRRSGKRAQGSLDGIGSGTKRLNSGFRQTAGAAGILRRGLIGITAALGVREVMAASDAYALLNSRLMVVEGNTAGVRGAFEQILQVANDTGQKMGTVADLYIRLSNATKELGASQSDVMGVTRTLGNLVRISGADAQSADAAITQLSQGLASGVLRGEEFNSVSEQLPVVLDVMTEALGKTRGELRAMAQDGQLTSEVVFEALMAAKDAAEQTAEGMDRTIGQSFQGLQNNLNALIGYLTNFSGASGIVVAALDGISQFIHDMRLEIEKVEKVISRLDFREIDAQLGGALSTVQAFVETAAKIAVAFNPLLLYAFGDSLIAVAEKGLTVKDIMYGTFEVIGQQISSASRWVGQFATEFDYISDAALGVGEAVQGAISGAISIAIGLLKNLVNAFASAFASFPAIAQGAFKAMLASFDAAINYMSGILSKFGAALQAAASLDFSGFGQGIADATSAIAAGPDYSGVKASFEDMTGELKEIWSRDIVGDAFGSLTDQGTEQFNSIRDKIYELAEARRDARLLEQDTSATLPLEGVGGAEGYISDSDEIRLQNLQRETDLINSQAGARGGNAAAANNEAGAKRATVMIEELQRENDMLQLVTQGRYASLEAARQELELRQQLQGATEGQIQKILELKAANEQLATSMEQQSQLGQQVGDTIAGGFEQALFSGKALDEVLKQLALDLAKLIFRATVGKAITNFFGGLFGGGGGAGGGLLGGLFANGAAFQSGHVVPFAKGGALVSKPTTFPMSGGRTGLMGEAGPEAIMPLSRGSNGKLGVAATGLGAGGGDGQTSNVFSFGDTIINVERGDKDGEEVGQEASAEFNRQVMNMVDGRIFEATRPGGLLYKAA